MATILLNNRFFVAIVLLLIVVGSVFGRSVPRFPSTSKEHTTTTNTSTTTTTAITPTEIIPVFDQNFFQHSIGEWKVWSVAAAMYLAMNALVYVLTYCCYLEKKCAVATVSPKSASASSSTVVEFSNVEYSESAKTANDLSVRTAKSLSLPSAKQTSRRPPKSQKTQKESERGTSKSQKSAKLPSTKSSEESTAKSTSTRTATSTKATTSKGTTTSTSKRTTETGKTSTTSGGSEGSKSSDSTEEASSTSAGSNESETSGGLSSMISSSLTSAKRLLQINYRLTSRLVGKNIPVSSQNKLTKNASIKMEEKQQNVKENKTSTNKHSLILGPITFPLTIDNRERILVKTTTVKEENERYLHIAKKSPKRFTFSYSNDAFLFLRSLDILTDEINENLHGIIDKCKGISKSKEPSSSSHYLHKSSSFVSPKGLCLVGLVWNLEQKELYCQIKYIYGIINLKNIKNNKTETLQIHWANLKANTGR
uniref:Uncharacterized protein n=1 Tax=Meloidogyne floridensis TaxID=298350 RepID=A0A915NL70_9BILA